MKTLRFTPLALLFLLLAMNALGQSPQAEPLVIGKIERIQSKHLGLERILNIYLPHGYDADTADYPLVYVLDGTAHEDMLHTMGLVQFLSMYGIMKPSVVVGIANVDRYHDFTYPSNSEENKKSLPQQGGSPQFIKFLGEELLPFIQSNYHVTQEKTLIGQSLGGLLATEVLMKQPSYFNNYVIVSPSLWWDDESLIKTAKDYFKSHQEIQANVFVTLGKEPPIMHKVAKMLYHAMKSSGNPKLKCAFQTFLEEDHATVLHKAAYAGLEWLGK